MNSYLLTDYSGKLHKRVVRKMLGRLAGRYSACIGSKMDYIGMGSLFYTDFTEFYGTGCIDGMKSIEDMCDNKGDFDEKKYKRFMLNRPYDEIELLPMTVREAVDRISFDKPSMVWFDYDSTVTHETIEEMADVIRRAKKSSMLLTCNGTQIAYSYKSEGRTLDLKVVRECFGKIAGSGDDTFFDGLTWENFVDNIYKTVTPYYERVVAEKNASEGKNYKLYELSNIEYRQPSLFRVKVWLLVDTDEVPEERIEKEMLSAPEAGYHLIDMTILTEREKKILEGRRDEDPEVLAEELCIDAEHIRKYFKYWNDIY